MCNKHIVNGGKAAGDFVHSVRYTQSHGSALGCVLCTSEGEREGEGHSPMLNRGRGVLKPSLRLPSVLSEIRSH